MRCERRPIVVTVLAVLAALATLGVLVAACAVDEREPSAQHVVDAGVDRVAAFPTVRVSDGGVADVGVDAQGAGTGTCNVRLDAPPLMDSPHVPDGTPVAYGSNPPSSGPHYPVWANFQEFTHPVEDGYLVHSLEHGAVLLLYDCAADGGACDDLVAALRAVRDAVPADPLCDPSIRVRVILAPRPGNDVAVAAAAWGNVYRADCVDAPSLARFITDHYAKAPESFCAPGSVF